MRGIFLGLVLILSSQVFSQETKLEPAVAGVQAGLLGGWFVYEPHLAKSMSLRMEAGADVMGIAIDGYFDKSFHTVLTLEPRWYYNINQRSVKGKTISGNSANFLALTTTYSPQFKYGSKGELFDGNKFIFSPKWGIRRTINKNFHYEAGFGFGYAIHSYTNPRWEMDIHLRIGYSFF